MSRVHVATPPRRDVAAASLAIAALLSAVGCEPTVSSRTPLPTPVAIATPDPGCPPPHDAPDLEAELPAAIEGLDPCRISIGNTADEDELIERLHIGALMFGVLADETGADLEDVAFAATAGEPDSLGLSVKRIDGVSGADLWDAFLAFIGQSGRVQRIAGRDVLVMDTEGEAYTDSAAWIEGDLLFEVHAYDDLAQVAAIIEAVADR